MLRLRVSIGAVLASMAEAVVASGSEVGVSSVGGLAPRWRRAAE